MKKILLVSDVQIGAHVNGVGVAIENRKRELEKAGYSVHVLDAQVFSYTFPLPSYPEIRLVVSTVGAVDRRIRVYNPDHIHIETEGTLGILARRACKKNGWSFTTSFHTRFQDYIYVRTHLSFLRTLMFRYLRWFHNAGKGTFVSTKSLQRELEQNGFTHAVVIPLGVDIELFRKNNDAVLAPPLTTPVFVYVGRVAIEKNITAFLDASLPGSKLIIGDGPAKAELAETYRDKAMFVGYKRGQELVDLLSIATVSVFPSKTDTFGLTILESMACGLPVAGYNVPGPIDVITNGIDGVYGDSLEESARACLSLSSEACRHTAEQYSWAASATKFAHALVPR